MERIVRHITQQLVNKLPERKDFFTPDQLRDFEIPEFIVERIEVEMERNLDDSVVPPYTEWADMNNDTVRKAWEQFIEAILAESRLPTIYAQSVFETAVADTVEILIQPRHNIPETIFGPDRALDLKTIEKRIKAVTVYKHLSSAVLRYMNRRNLQALTYEQCENIIDKVDEKLVAHYNPLNWTQMLSPLFELLGNNVDSNLLRLFFEDKGRNRIARKFDMLNSSVSKTQVIEILSSPDLLDLDGFEESQSSLFKEDEKSKGDLIRKMGKAASEGSKKPLYPGGPEIPDMKKSTFFGKEDDKKERDDAILSTFHKRRSYYGPEEETEQEEMDERLNEELENKEISSDAANRANRDTDTESIQDNEDVEDDKSFENNINEPSVDNPFEDDEEGLKSDEEKPLHKLFVLDESAIEEKETDDNDDPVAEEESLNSIFEMEEHDIEDVPEVDSIDEKVKGTENKDAESELEVEEEDAPMWQKFLSTEELSDQIDLNKKQKESTHELIDAFADSDDDEKENKKAQILDLSALYSERKEDATGKLSDWLSSDKKRFVREIFNDSEKAYNTAIHDILDCDDWKSASRYLEKDVFSRNMVDMYSDEAVDFTDRLHSFFREYKSSQTKGNG